MGIVSVRWCARCRRRAPHVFVLSRHGGRWLCDRCKGRELEPVAVTVKREGAAA